jgi:hypothetical protein
VIELASTPRFNVAANWFNIVGQPRPTAAGFFLIVDHHENSRLFRAAPQLFAALLSPLFLRCYLQRMDSIKL